MEVSQPLDHITHAVIGGGKTIDFGISNSPEFFDILSRTLYTDQILAVVREVLCNAWDAHIASGRTDVPIKVTLDSNVFIVSDSGFGISKDDIGPIYGVYGASTKKNDGTQTGGFGLGCKAPFAYTDHFEVTSCHNGMKTIYNMSKSNAQAAGKPGIIPIASFPSTESGLQVKINIQPKDYRKFKDAVIRIIENGEMNAELNSEKVEMIEFSRLPHGFLMTTRNVLGNRNENILVRYGNVIYPVQECDGIASAYGSVQKVLERFSNFYTPYILILQAKPDTISVTPSRESLSMQEHTIKTLNTLMNAFCKLAKGLNTEILAQSKTLTEQAVTDKNYNTLFSHDWAFTRDGFTKDTLYIQDVPGMAKQQLCNNYPIYNLKFRINDIRNRVEHAIQGKIVDKHLALSFLKDLNNAKEVPSRYSRIKNLHSSNWLHRMVLSKIVTRMRAQGIDASTLGIIDRNHPVKTASTAMRLVPLHDIYGRSPLLNLPFLRKVVVIATAVTTLSDRYSTYCGFNKETQNDGVLYYHVRSRKAGAVDDVIKLFEKMKYEIIDLTKKQSWEVVDEVTKAPRKKPEPYVGLPSIKNIVRKNETIYLHGIHRSDAEILPAPKYVMVISSKTKTDITLDNFTTKATRAVIALYGDVLGVAKDKNEYNKAIKRGAVDFYTALEEHLLNTIKCSAAIKEYRAFDFHRASERTKSYEVDFSIMRIIYGDLEIRKEFKLKYSLNAEEENYLILCHQWSGMSQKTSKAIDNFMRAVPIAKVNYKIIEMLKYNEMLKMLDGTVMKQGLKGPKRQTYLDVILKILKG